MKAEDVPRSWGICALLSEDCLTLGVGLGSEMYAVAVLQQPIPPREWEAILGEEFDNPADGAIQRAIDRAAAKYGLRGIYQPLQPITGAVTPLGRETNE